MPFLAVGKRWDQTRRYFQKGKIFTYLLNTEWSLLTHSGWKDFERRLQVDTFVDLLLGRLASYCSGQRGNRRAYCYSSSFRGGQNFYLLVIPIWKSRKIYKITNKTFLFKVLQWYYYYYFWNLYLILAHCVTYIVRSWVLQLLHLNVVWSSDRSFHSYFSNKTTWRWIQLFSLLVFFILSASVMQSQCVSRIISDIPMHFCESPGLPGSRFSYLLIPFGYLGVFEPFRPLWLWLVGLFPSSFQFDQFREHMLFFATIAHILILLISETCAVFSIYSICFSQKLNVIT